MEQIVDSYIYNDDILARGAFSEIFKGKHQKVYKNFLYI